MKHGIVLEGGAMRGLFTAGIIDIFLENNIKFDGAIGTSAGAVFGCNLKSGQIGRTLRYNIRFCKDWRYGSLWSLLRSGDMYDYHFCYEVIPNELDIFDTAAYRANPMEFRVVCVDVETGEPVYHLCPNGDETDIRWFGASGSMPLVSNIIEIDGRKLLDGGVVDSIALKAHEDFGFEKNVVILTQPRDFEKEQTIMWRLIKWRYPKYPKLAAAWKRRAEEYNQTLRYIEQREKEGKVLVLAPPKILPVKRVDHDPEHLRAAYEIGRQVGQENLEKVRKFLEN